MGAKKAPAKKAAAKKAPAKKATAKRAAGKKATAKKAPAKKIVASKAVKKVERKVKVLASVADTLKGRETSSGRRSAIIEEITLPMLSKILHSIGKVKGIEQHDDFVLFKYRDQDGDDIPARVSIEADEKVFCRLLLVIPDTVFVTGLICANLYNLRTDTHGTFAFAMQGGDSYYIALETHILTRGGVSEASVKHALQNFISHIDLFEAVMISAIKEFGPDDSFMKSAGWGVFWEAAGAFMRGISRS